jgi:hypothetical protein
VSRYFSRSGDTLRVGRSRDRMPVGARYSAPVQTDRGAHPAYFTIGTESLLSGVKRSERAFPASYRLLSKYS